MEQQSRMQAKVICRSSIMRSAVAASLESHGIDCSDGKNEADVAIVVSGLIENPEPGACIMDLENIQAKQWIVLTRIENDPVCKSLTDFGIDPCIIPEDINGDDLSYVVRLAGSGHVLSMGRFCRNSHPEDAKALARAHLTKECWVLLAHLAQGLSNKEIALLEDSSEGAIKARLRRLLRKLNMSNRTKAAVLAARCGITGSPAE